jgi:secondary thiamine-phosphate synthase enzyme
VITGRRLAFRTSRATEFVDLTARLQDQIRDAGLVNGRVHLQSLHTTLGLTINENEPLLLGDLEALLDQLVPAAASYGHDDLSRRVGVAPDEPANGHAHCRNLLLLPAHTALVEEGRIVLGRWQSIFAVELDGPRSREIALQLDGEFVPAEAPSMARRLVDLELARQILVDPEAVQMPMRRLVEAGGKRLRPTLTLIGARLGPLHDPLRSAALAAAIELIHCATLVHDDYVDESPRRHGTATVAAAEGPARAIAVGDYYFAKATRVIAELGSSNVTSTIAEAMEEICLSQIADFELRGSYPGDRGSYLKVVRGKTAALIQASCVAGAQLSAAPAEVVDTLRRYGEMVGVAFQMVDDLLDYSPESGKPVGQDIRQRVVSLPLIYAAEDDRVGGEVRELLAGPLNDEHVARVADLVRDSGALERVQGEARGLVRMAVHELTESDLDGAGATLVEMAEASVERRS